MRAWKPLVPLRHPPAFVIQRELRLWRLKGGAGHNSENIPAYVEQVA